ncbi:MAG: helix-turn-helix transcriptional regulator [Deltaproteobacteria bacterium]|jgi:transcriptional regulator with XRE-family HTH domain|nr:helix-turn-helix transcriptional regulator [Deltaproteobacteria bacterium]
MANILKTRLTRRRQELGMTQRNLAKKIGRVPTTISSYESGHREPSLDTLIRMAKVLNCSVDWLLGVDVPVKESSKAPAWTCPIMEDLVGLKRPNDQRLVKTVVKVLVKSLSQL